jgi:hypothetical protein
MEVAEECCWTKTQATGQSCCGKLSFSVVDSGFQLGSLTHAYISDHTNIEFRLAPELLRKPTCVCMLDCFEMVGLRVKWIREADVLMINITGRFNLSFSLPASLQKAYYPWSWFAGLRRSNAALIPIIPPFRLQFEKFRCKNAFPKVTSGDDKGRRRNCSPLPPLAPLLLTAKKRLQCRSHVTRRETIRTRGNVQQFGCKTRARYVSTLSTTGETAVLQTTVV